ncbi:hypothetical protein SESBI_09483 [Sesbania bispinosa]|nr:hypothetical protein SESBI_09483 [Sesbania bispinosa]
MVGLTMLALWSFTMLAPSRASLRVVSLPQVSLRSGVSLCQALSVHFLLVSIKGCHSGSEKAFWFPLDLISIVGPSTLFSSKQFEVFDVELLSIQNAMDLIFQLRIDAFPFKESDDYDLTLKWKWLWDLIKKATPGLQVKRDRCIFIYGAKMFRSTNWRTEKNIIKAVFKLHFHVTQGLKGLNFSLGFWVVMEQKHVLLSALSVGVGLGVGLRLSSGQAVQKWVGGNCDSDEVSREQIVEELKKLMVDGNESKVTFDDFPYYLR